MINGVGVNAADWGVPTDGVNSATASIQTMIDAAVSGGAKEIFFPDGTYLLTNTRNDASYTCAIVINGLKNCVIRGTKSTKFTVSATGSPTVGFGFFRLEQCENVKFEFLELDGSGVAVTTGSNRLFGIAAVNFNVNSASIDLPVTNKQLEFSHLYLHDCGGGIQIIRRTLSIADTPMTDGLSVHDCRMENLLGVDHGVAAPRTRNIHVFNNSFVNDIATKTIQDNMAVDISSGAEVAHIHNNYVYGFMFGMKCESTNTAGPSGTEVRASKRVTFENNRLKEIGDPTVFIIPGPSGGDTFGIKVNGKDCLVIGNTVKPRTVNVTTGGLALGIVVVNTHNEDSHVLVEGNTVYGCQYGVLQNDTTSTTNECSVDIRSNRTQDASIYGILAQANCTVDSNRILRAGKSAIAIQIPVENTFIRNNIAIDCASINNNIIPNTVVFYQEGTGPVGLFTFENNTIVDMRGASAAQYGYYFRTGIGNTNPFILSPGYTYGLLNALGYDKYFSVVGETLAFDAINSVGPRTLNITNSPAVLFPWSTMTWRVGDRAVMSAPAIGSPKAWVCTVAGTPGTWVSEGNL
jgi:hypothetical protein